jgi:hypothetical protein
MSKATTMRASQPFTYRNTNTYHWRTNGSRWELVTGPRWCRMPSMPGCGESISAMVRSRTWSTSAGRRKRPRVVLIMSVIPTFSNAA